MKKLLLLFTATFFLCADIIAQSPGACSSKNPSPLDGSTFLGQTYNNSACGLNYVQASQLIETRTAAWSFNTNGTGLPTTLSVSSIPSSSMIMQAYVWYVVSYIGGSPQASSVDITNTFSVTSTSPATIIGTDQPKCWGDSGTAVYRADVTSAISGNGNYGININGITGTSGNFPNWYDQVDGITLFIIYKDFTATYQGSLVVWDGNMTGVGSSYQQTMTGINACGNSTYANAFNIVSDMQGNVNGNAHPSTLNGVTTNFSNDMWNFDDTTTTVTSGQATATFGTSGLGSDCFTWAVMGLYYQTTNCVICTGCTTTVATVDSVISTSACTSNDGAIYISDSTSAPPLAYSWSNGATTQDITGLTTGTYIITITDSTGCSIMFSVTVSSPTNLSILLDSVTTVSCTGGNNGAISVSILGGTPPYTYNWSNGATTQDIAGLLYGTYTLIVTDASGCTAIISVSNQAISNVPVPSICMVTVDSLSQNNVVMWDKTSFSGVDSFIVYREIFTNNYMPLGAVSYDSLSLFVDTVRAKYFPNTGDPNAGTYRYKIQLRDSCGNFSLLSPYHNTIFMTGNNGNFSWPFYTIENGPNPVNAYVLMRDDYSNGNWNAINSVSGTQQTVTDPAYAAWQSTANYRIQTIWSITCTPSRLNSQVLASFNASLSNTLNPVVNSVNESAVNNSISIYPNPTSGKFQITSDELRITNVEIYNVYGEKVYSTSVIGRQSSVIDISDVPRGIYFLHLKTSDGIAVKKIVKE